MKKISKIISVILTVFLLMSQLCCVAFAEGDQANVTITSNVDGLTRITNKIGSDGTHADVEGTYIQGGVITFTFSEEMDVNTLTPENIIITLGSAGLVKSDKLNSQTLVWSYEPCYEPTSTTYSIDIADLCEGYKDHTVTFTSNVKTIGGKAIVETTKTFTTGRIATTSGYAGSVLKNVAYQRPAKGENGSDRGLLTTYSPQYNNRYATYTGGSDNWVRIDLGNYYDVADVVVYIPYTASGAAWQVNKDVVVAYSCDPDATGATATNLGTIDDAQYWTDTNGNYYASDGGLGFSGWLHPKNSVRARYIFVRANNGGTSGQQLCNVEVIAPVDTVYGEITAKKNNDTVNAFDGAGEYVVSVPVTEYVSGTSDGYMIVAGYDASGVITKINCLPVTKADGVLSLATTFTDTTKSLKAVLIKDFTQPQMLTDALVLPAPTATE